MSDRQLGEKLIAWAGGEPGVIGLVQIGSRVRGAGEPGAADVNSDWDFQLIVNQPEVFGSPEWLRGTDLGPVCNYVARGGRLGSSRKVSVVLEDGELDLILIPHAQLRGIQQEVREGRHVANPATLRALADLSLVLLGGYRILKGHDEIGGLYDFVARQFQPPRLADADVVELAAGFVADYVSLRRKLERGELLAAQRWLHHQLLETNFRLLHELRQRRRLATFPDARRIELTAEPAQIAAVRISAVLSKDSLRTAADASADACRSLVRELVGEAWRWPRLPSGLRSE